MLDSIFFKGQIDPPKVAAVFSVLFLSDSKTVVGVLLWFFGLTSPKSVPEAFRHPKEKLIKVINYRQTVRFLTKIECKLTV